MGDLKTLRAQQESLVLRAKEWNQKLLLAGTGVVGRIDAESVKLLDKYAAVGATVLGERAAGKSRAFLAARGVADAASKVDLKTSTDTLADNVKVIFEQLPEKRKALYEELVATGRAERGTQLATANELVLAGWGTLATVRNKGRQLFDTLVSEGNKSHN